MDHIPNAAESRIMENVEQIQENILNEASVCMARIMDECELEIGDSARWVYVRSRILKIFGDRGFAGKIRQILSEPSHD